jgi:hypothetical protein
VELDRGLKALSGRIEGVLKSRTWKALTSAGGIMLRITGKKP